MINYLLSENLKYRRTFSRKLIVLSPMFFILYSFFTLSNLGSQNNYFITLIFNWWPLLFMPVGSALLCSLSDAKERKSGNYRGLRTLNINAAVMWFSKIVIIAYYMFLASVILVAIVFLAGVWMPSNSAPFLQISAASLTIWVTSIGLIPVYLFFSTWMGTAAAMGISVAGMVTGIMMSTESSWIMIPWSWGLRLMCPIIGVHPNGTTLPANDPLLNSSVIPMGIMISLVFFVVMSLLTAIWFSKREAR
ncbi:lantibiotic immunity ABC transporter MutE/EpiE family permease subunit [Paenibacillus monticola]|uniref:Lantibiotic immunity ABC transporter MutE/EpiE family permease subunit n=1 Tax=Paenibacillus monticola TaxID=2666075 RepID=A0A7X2H4E5_9BACL|nr:lantibiotic immunity ABC transporter MutE/EpiE family permease subunit [Paenibacillus monticola]MRN53175.1 lantibiotic immunity ABC transporter MutE/EpiE family permease subunit [Paenibacillus monticola]